MDAQDIRNLSEAYNQVHQLDEAVKGQNSDLRRAASSERQTEKAAHSKWKKSSPGTKKKPRFSSVPNTDTTASGYADQQSQEISWHDKKTKGKFIHGMSRNEEVDLYDIILSHLLDEGYAETSEAAEAIMVNMSEEWREDIMETSDRKVKAVRNAREKQWNNQFGKNRVQDPTDDMVNKVDKLIDQRNKRTGSNVKKTTMGQLSDKYRKG